MRVLGGASGRVKPMSKSNFMRRAMGAGLAGALVLSIAWSVAAAPVLSSTAEVKSAAPTAEIDARWRRWGWRRSWGWRRGYFIGPTYRYGGWYSNSGCHIAGGYHRPDGCW
jgi:hypothetical protein